MEISQPVVLRVRGLSLLTLLIFSGTSLARAASSFIGPLSNISTLCFVDDATNTFNLLH